jgi:hypothetical protein
MVQRTREQCRHAMPGIALLHEVEVVGPFGVSSGVGSGTRSLVTRVRDDQVNAATSCVEAYLDLLLTKSNLLNKFLTRCLVGLWVAFICLFQDYLILSATALVRDDLKRFQLLPKYTSSSFFFV